MDSGRYVTQSELRSFKKCPLAWQLSVVEGLSPMPGMVTLKRDRGTIWHAQLEARYLSLKDGFSVNSAETLKRVLERLNHEFEIRPGQDVAASDEFALQRWMYDDYARVYAGDDRYTVVGVEEAFEFPFPVEGAPEMVITGRIDLEVEETLETGPEAGRVVRRIWDHKTVGQRDVSKDGYIMEMLFEDQFPLYQAAKRRLGEPVDGVIYDACRTDRLKREMLDSERFIRHLIDYPAETLDTVWEDNRMAAQALVRAEQTGEVYSAPNARTCGYSCDFNRVHIEGRATGRSYVEIAKGYGFTQAVDRYPDANRAPVEQPMDQGDEW
jgi:hypothetical protein